MTIKEFISQPKHCSKCCEPLKGGLSSESTPFNDTIVFCTNCGDIKRGAVETDCFEHGAGAN